MRLFYFWVLIGLFGCLEGAEKWPRLFYQQLAPLLHAKETLGFLDINGSLLDKYLTFSDRCDKTILLGLKADETKKENDVSEYLFTVRKLQSDYNQVFREIKVQVIESLKQEDCEKLLKFQKLDLEDAFISPSERKKISLLYQQHCKNTRIEWIESIIEKDELKEQYEKKDKSTTALKNDINIKNYKNKIPILLFINSNPSFTQDSYQRLKELFEKYRFQYVIYDIYKSKKSIALLKRYSPPNTMYYPTIVIGKQVIYGEGNGAIFDAIKKEWFADNPLEILQTE